MADEPLLDLKTVTGRFHVRIDGAPHFLAHPDSLTLYQTSQLEQMGPRVNELMIAAFGREFSVEEDTELNALLDRGVRIVLDAPDVVHGILTQSHRIQILTAFMRLRHENSRTVGAPKTAASQPTGAKRSRDSKGSTVALQKAG